MLTSLQIHKYIDLWLIEYPYSNPLDSKQFVYMVEKDKKV